MRIAPGKIVVPLDGGYNLAVDGDPNGEVRFFLQNGGGPKPLTPKLDLKDLVKLAVAVLEHEWTAEVASHQAVPFRAVEQLRRAAAVRGELERWQPIGRWGPPAPSSERRLFKELKGARRGGVSLHFVDSKWCFSHDRMSFVLLADLLAAVVRDELLVDHTDLWRYHVPWLCVRPDGHWQGTGLAPNAPAKLVRQDLSMVSLNGHATKHVNGTAHGVVRQPTGGVATAVPPVGAPVTVGSPGALLFLLKGLAENPQQLGIRDDQVPSFPSLVGVAAVVVDELQALGIEPQPITTQPPTLSESDRQLLEEAVRRDFLVPHESKLSERERQLAEREAALAAKIEQFKQEQAAALEEIAGFEQVLSDQSDSVLEEQLRVEAAYADLGKAWVVSHERGAKVEAPSQAAEETEEERVKRLRRKHGSDLARLLQVVNRVHRVQTGSKRKDLSAEDVEWAKKRVAEFQKLKLFTERELKMLTTKGFIQSP